jgi:signal transduction histidine kinase
MYSLRRTLSVRFSLTMFVALMLIGMGAFVGVSRTLNRLTDQSLISALELESDVLALGRSVAQSPYQSDITAFVEGINRFVVVREASGQIVVRNTPLASGLPLNSAAFQEALNGRRSFSTERWADGQIRSLYSPTPPGSHPGFAVLQVSASLSPMARTDRAVFLLIFGIVIMATAGTALGAGWLAKSAVAPVTLITERAKAIHAGTLKRRISAHADTVEFHGLVGVLNSMLDRLDRALTAQRRIIADVGHELRTPITAMQGELEIALRGKRTPEEYRTVLQSCLEEAQHLSDIDESLLLLARLEAGEHQADPIPVQVCDLVEQCIALARASAPSHTFEFSPCCDTPTVLADSKLVRLVVDQLLDNSVKHTPPGTRVRAIVECLTTEFVLTIEDDGPGIPETALPHLFDRFWQADPSRTRGSGPGLGLTIAAAVAEAHAGSVAAGTSEMGGLKVTMHLPLSGVIIEAPPEYNESHNRVKISS